MEKGTTKIIFWSATALILIGGGYYGYTLYAKSQKEKKEKEEQEKKEKENANKKDENKKDTPKKDYVAPSKLPSTGFKTKAEGDAFRTYVRANYSADATKWSLDPSGNQDNDTIRLAYSFYGEIYKKSLSTSVVVNTTTPPPPTTLKKDDKVNAIKDTKTYSGYTMATPYTKGANDNNGVYKTGNYIGVVKQIVGSATQVTRYSAPYPQVSYTWSTDDVDTFWVKTTDVEKSLI